MKYVLQMEIMLPTIKVFTILFLLCLWEQGTPWQFSKQKILLSIECPDIFSSSQNWRQKKNKKFSFQLNVQIYSLLRKTKGKRKAIFRGCKKGNHIVILFPRVIGCHKRWKSFSFYKIWNNPTPPLSSVRPPYKLTLQDMEFYDKLVNTFQDLSKVENPAVRKAKE